jgi:antitoxin StbD
MSITQTIFARNTVGLSDLRRNPSEVIEAAYQSPVAILNHNRLAAYLISAPAYEEMLEQLEDATLTKIVKARVGGQTIKVKLKNLYP